jgi:hypothetical protein
MGCLSWYNDGMLWANYAALIADTYPHRSLEDQHRLFDRVFVEWCGSAGSYDVDEQTHTASSVLGTCQELTAKARSHLDLCNLLMVDD